MMILMAPGMVTNRVTISNHLLKHLRMPFHLLSYHKKGCFDVVLLENTEYLGGRVLPGTIIKRQCNHFLCAVDLDILNRFSLKLNRYRKVELFYCLCFGEFGDDFFIQFILLCN